MNKLWADVHKIHMSFCSPSAAHLCQIWVIACHTSVKKYTARRRMSASQIWWRILMRQMTFLHTKKEKEKANHLCRLLLGADTSLCCGLFECWSTCHWAQRSIPSSPQVSHVNMNAFYPPLSHCSLLALKKHFKKIQRHGHHTHFPAWYEFVCVCVCDDMSDRDLLFYSWKWCPHPAISVTHSPRMSITALAGIKPLKG